MSDRSQPDLEAFIHEELQRLPELTPPGILTQRVRQAILEAEAEAARPWWRRAWWSWPAPWKVASTVVFALLGIVICVMPWALEEVVAGVSGRVGQLFAPLEGLFGAAVSLLNAMELVGRSVARNPWVLIVAGAALGAYLLLVGVGTFYVRFAVHHSRSPARHE